MLLVGDDLGDLRLQEALVVGGVEPALAQVAAGGADLGRLRERADRRRRQLGQRHALLLRLAALADTARRGRSRRPQRARAAADRRGRW